MCLWVQELVLVSLEPGREREIRLMAKKYLGGGGFGAVSACTVIKGGPFLLPAHRRQQQQQAELEEQEEVVLKLLLDGEYLQHLPAVNGPATLATPNMRAISREKVILDSCGASRHIADVHDVVMLLVPAQLANTVVGKKAAQHARTTAASAAASARPMDCPGRSSIASMTTGSADQPPGGCCI